MIVLIIILFLLLLISIKNEFFIDIKTIPSILLATCGVLLMNHQHKNSLVKYGGGGRSKKKIHIEPRLKLTVKYCNDKRCTDAIPVTEDIKHLIKTNKPPHLSHVPIDATHAEEFSRCISDDSPAQKYVTRRTEFKRVLHWGQLKLMLTEIEFLTLVMTQYNESKDSRDIYFVYAGAAPGHHTDYLSALFPTIHFELYDPSKFEIKNTKMIKIHNGYFTDDIAEYWGEQKKDRYVVFCSDIRTVPADDINVRANMDMQLAWWTKINPELSMFKFRLPWDEGFTEYPEGKIYIQPYPGPTSTETRLIVKADAKLVKYDNTKYENQLFYHNTVSRYKLYDCVLGKLSLEHDHLDNCYDCVSFISIVEDYLKLMKQRVDKTSIYTLVQEIQNKITHIHNIYSQTIRNFNEYMKVLGTYTFKKKNDEIVSMCNHNKSAKRYDPSTYVDESKATLTTYKSINRKDGGSQQSYHHTSHLHNTHQQSDHHTSHLHNTHHTSHQSNINDKVHSCEDDKCYESHHIHFLPDGDKYDADTIRESTGDDLDDITDEIVY